MPRSTVNRAEGRRTALRRLKRRGRHWGTSLIRSIFTAVAFLAWLRGGPGVFQRTGRRVGRDRRNDLGGEAASEQVLGDVKKVLLIRLDLLGDVILTMPAVAALRERYPEARITMLVLPYTAPVLELFPYVDRVLTFDLNKMRPSGDMLNFSHYRDLWRLVRRLRRERYDLAVSFYGLHAGILSFVSGARLRIGYGGEGCPLLFNVPVPGRRYETAQHEAEYNLTLARAAGAFTSPPTPSPLAERGLGGEVTLIPKIPDGVGDKVSALLDLEGIGPQDLLVAIHPGSTNGEAKRWTTQGWAGLADRLATGLGARVIINGVASELSLVQQITGQMKTRPVVMAGKTSVLELAGLLARCRVLVSGDSAPLHLASALGVPVVGLYGPTDPAIVGPFGRGAILLRKGLPCSPCYSLQDVAECRRESVACMEAITQEEVFGAVERALRELAPTIPTEPR